MKSIFYKKTNNFTDHFTGHSTKHFTRYPTKYSMEYSMEHFNRTPLSVPDSDQDLYVASLKKMCNYNRVSEGLQ